MCVNGVNGVMDVMWMYLGLQLTWIRCLGTSCYSDGIWGSGTV